MTMNKFLWFLVLYLLGVVTVGGFVFIARELLALLVH